MYITSRPSSSVVRRRSSSVVVRRPTMNLYKGSFFLIAPVFPEGSKKRKSKNDNKHGKGQEKIYPQHYVEGKNSTPDGTGQRAYM